MTPMRLTQLGPEWVGQWKTNTWRHVERAGAQGVLFWCPVCFQKNGGSTGTHVIICWSRSAGVPDDADPGPGRWKLIGETFDTLTLDGDAPGGGGARSVFLNSPGSCGAHFYVTNGEVKEA
jgi:hypothetical protein